MIWNERKVNDIPSNPLLCYWAIGDINGSKRLFRIEEQYPVREDGFTIVDGSKPELYILFETTGGRRLTDVMPTSEEPEYWEQNGAIWGDYVFSTCKERFVRAYDTLDKAKARAEVQVNHIKDLIDTWCK